MLRLVHIRCAIIALVFITLEFLFIYAYETVTGPLNIYEMSLIVFVFPVLCAVIIKLVLIADAAKRINANAVHYNLRCANCDALLGNPLVDDALVEKSPLNDEHLRPATAQVFTIDNESSELNMDMVGADADTTPLLGGPCESDVI